MWRWDPLAVAHAVDPQIVGDELYLRIQRWALKPSGYAPQHRGLSSPQMRFSCYCYALDKFVLAEIDHLHAQQESLYVTCAHCGEVCHVMFQRWVHGSCATVTTRWLSLGRGLDPNDKPWNRNTSPEPGCYRLEDLAKSKQAPTQAALFELHAEQPFEAQAKQLQRLMVSRSYQKSFQWTEEKYHFSGSRRWFKSGRMLST
jgi:hypothetical protein